MNGYVGVSEAAAHLGISDRRVRQLIRDARIPAERIVGRWAIPASFLDTHPRHLPGRPLAEHSAWAILQCLSGTRLDTTLPKRLRERLNQLPHKPDPAATLASWMAARTIPVHAAGAAPAIDLLLRDPRIVLTGAQVLRDEDDASLRVYVAARDLDAVIAFHNLAVGPTAPHMTLCVVQDLALVPRSPSNDRHAAALVAALDLSDSSGERSTTNRIVNSAITSLAAPPPGPPPTHTYADRRPHVIIEQLSDLTGPHTGRVDLPLRLDWTPKRRYDLTDAHDRQTLYERVLTEALHTADLREFLNADLLIELWPQLWLPPTVRTLWEDRFPQQLS